MTAFVFFVLSLLFSAYSQAELKRLVVCTDKSYWYPFVFTELYEVQGLYLDMIKDASDRLGIRVSVRPMDWKKCLRQVKSGKVSGVLGASYKDKRAEYMYYPEDAKTAKTSDKRLTQVEYVIVNHAENSYIYKDNVKTLPMPVRVPRGYSVAEDLKAEGVPEVDTTSRGDQGTILRLVTDKKGSVVTLGTIARHFENHKLFEGQLKIQSEPYKSKSYFLAFAKTSTTSRPPVEEADRKKIWEALRAVREDTVLMNSYLEKY